MLSGLATWVQDVIESLGYLGVAILVIVENLFPPIPSEIVLPFAGFVAQRGDASVVVMILAATIGSVVGHSFCITSRRQSDQIASGNSLFDSANGLA